MLAETYFDFRSLLDRQGAILTYCGLVSEQVLVALGETLKHKLAEQQTGTDVRRRVFSIFIEQVQNVMRYSDERLEPGSREQPPGAGLVMVGVADGKHFVVCGNFIPDAKAPRLKERLDQVSSMDAGSLRQFYREKLRDQPDEDSVGATVGLIEIARRSSQPIEYDFCPAGDDKSFFCLKAFV